VEFCLWTAAEDKALMAHLDANGGNLMECVGKHCDLHHELVYAWGTSGTSKLIRGQLGVSVGGQVGEGSLLLTSRPIEQQHP
jgi:hypothetical protein